MTTTTPWRTHVCGLNAAETILNQFEADGYAPVVVELIHSTGLGPVRGTEAAGGRGEVLGEFRTTRVFIAARRKEAEDDES